MIFNYIQNIKSKVIKEGVMDFFSHSCLFLQSIYNSKPEDCVIISFVSRFLASLILLLSTIIYNITKDHSGFLSITLIVGLSLPALLAMKMD